MSPVATILPGIKFISSSLDFIEGIESLALAVIISTVLAEGSGFSPSFFARGVGTPMFIDPGSNKSFSLMLLGYLTITLSKSNFVLTKS